MPSFTAQVEYSPIWDASTWEPEGEPVTVEADDAMWAALQVCRDRRLAQGRQRVVVDGRIFHPGVPHV